MRSYNDFSNLAKDISGMVLTDAGIVGNAHGEDGVYFCLYYSQWPVEHLIASPEGGNAEWTMVAGGVARRGRGSVFGGVQRRNGLLERAWYEAATGILGCGIRLQVWTLMVWLVLTVLRPPAVPEQARSGMLMLNAGRTQPTCSTSLHSKRNRQNDTVGCAWLPSSWHPSPAYNPGPTCTSNPEQLLVGSGDLGSRTS